MILTQGESWSDLRVSDALKKETEEDPQLDETDCRLVKPKVSVALIAPDSMQQKVADTIKLQLQKSRSDNILRKPILVCTKEAETAKILTSFLKEELSDSNVKKIMCLTSYRDVDEQFDLLGKQTVYVVAD